MDKAGNRLFKETNRTVRKLLEKVPAINHAISEVDRQRIEYEAKLMKEAKKEMENEVNHDNNNMGMQRPQVEVEI